MLKKLLITAALLILPSAAMADPTGVYTGYAPPDSANTRTMVVGSSGNVAASAAIATLPAINGKTTFICGFSITSSGSTGAAVVSPTVGPLGAGSTTLTYTYASVAGATLANAPLVVNYNPCIPSNTTAGAITVFLPSLGAGNTNATVTTWGYTY